MIHQVFVYGTLKLGYGNNQLLQGSTFVGQARTLKPFWMLSTGGFPVVFDDKRIYPVSGELWEVTEQTLLRLDRLEGHPTWYCRKETLVDIADTGIHDTGWMYIGVPRAWPNREKLDKVGINSEGQYAWSR